MENKNYFYRRSFVRSHHIHINTYIKKKNEIQCSQKVFSISEIASFSPVWKCKFASLDDGFFLKYDKLRRNT